MLPRQDNKIPPRIIPHVEEPFFALETGATAAPLTAKFHMMAGAMAGLCEHVFMFPIDTVKTRMQSLQQPQYSGVMDALKSIAKEERGIFSMYRGVSAVLIGAIPSHALYFATYEKVKKELKILLKPFKQNPNQQQQPSNIYQNFKSIIPGCAGIAATAMHDALSTPIDVIKQRMQIRTSAYNNIFDCFRHTLKEEGISAFYVSYPTTLLMNIPYTFVHFIVYESTKSLLINKKDEKTMEYNDKLWRHLVAGATAGATGAAISNPFDVIKTRLQTQGVFGIHNGGFRQVISDIHRTEGFRGFTRGAVPRMLYFAPSAAITWSVYEVCKEVLLVTNNSNVK